MLPGDAMDRFGRNTINGFNEVHCARGEDVPYRVATHRRRYNKINEIVNNRCYVIIDKSRMSLKTAADEVVHR